MSPVFCRITGRSKGLPKPNYFPLLPPISPADAKRFCRITGKAFALDPHHYIPIFDLLSHGHHLEPCHVTLGSSAQDHPPTNYPPIDPGGGLPITRRVKKGRFRALCPLSVIPEGGPLAPFVVPSTDYYAYFLEKEHTLLLFPQALEDAIFSGAVDDAALTKDTQGLAIRTSKDSATFDLKITPVKEIEALESGGHLHPGGGPSPEALQAKKKSKVKAKTKGLSMSGNIGFRKRIFDAKEEQAEESERRDSEKIAPSAKKVEEIQRKIQKVTESHVIGGIQVPLIEIEEVPPKEFLKKEVQMGLTPNLRAFSEQKKKGALFGAMVQWVDDDSVRFYEETSLPKDILNSTEVKKVIPGQFIEEENGGKLFVPGKIIKTADGDNFMPGQVVRINNQDKFVPGIVLSDSKFVPGQFIRVEEDEATTSKFVPGQIMVDGKTGISRFVPGQVIETLTGGPCFIPGQIVWTENGSRFLPGQVIEDPTHGVRFLPGKVVEDPDQGVKFVPGSVVETEEGLHFIAPDFVTSESGFEFSLQTYELSPEELKLVEKRESHTPKPNQKPNLSRQMSRAPETLLFRQESIQPVSPNDLRQIFSSSETVIDSTVLESLNEAGVVVEGSSFSVPSVQVEFGPFAPGSPSLQVPSRSLNRSVSINTFQVFHQVLDNLTERVGEVEKSFQRETTLNSENLTQVMTSVLTRVCDCTTKKAEDVVNAIVLAAVADLLKEGVSELPPEVVKKMILDKVRDCIKKPSSKGVLGTSPQVIGRAIEALSSGIVPNFVQEQTPKSVPQKEPEPSELSPEIRDLESILEGSESAPAETARQMANLLKASAPEDRMLQDILLSSSGGTLEKVLRRVKEKLTEKSKSAPGSLNLKSVLSGVLLEECDHQVEEFMRSAKRRSPRSTLSPLGHFEESHRSFDFGMDPEARELLSQAISLAQLMGKRDVAGELEQVLRDVEYLALISDDPEVIFILRQLTVMKRLAGDDSERVEKILTLPTELVQAPEDISDPMLRELVRKSSLLTEFVLPRPDEGSLEESPDPELKMERIGQMVDDLLGGLDKSEGPPPSEERPFVFLKDGFNAVIPREAARKIVAGETAYTLVDESGVRFFEPMEKRRVSLKSFQDDFADILGVKKSSEMSHDVQITEVEDDSKAEEQISTSKRIKLEEFDLGSATELLDTSAAKHKIAVRPGKRRPASPRHHSGSHGHTKEKETNPQMEREATISELIETEEEFVRDLRFVIEKYYNHMDEPGVPRHLSELRDLLFGNLKLIYEFHSAVLLEGVKYYAHQPKMIGRTFLRLERDFDKHVAYCRDQPAAEEFLLKNDSIRDYFDEYSTKIGDEKTLPEHLQLPIQRINDYQVLLRDLVTSSRSLGEDTNDLGNALELMIAIPQKPNDLKFLNSIEGYRGNIGKLGRLLKHDWFTINEGSGGAEGKGHERYLFLFKTRILVTKVRRISEDRSIFILKEILRLPELELEDLDEVSFQLTDDSGGVKVIVGSTSSEIKQDWLKEIKLYAQDKAALAEHAADDLQIEERKGSEDIDSKSSGGLKSPTPKLVKQTSLPTAPEAEEEQEVQATTKEVPKPKRTKEVLEEEVAVVEKQAKLDKVEKAEAETWEKEVKSSKTEVKEVKKAEEKSIKVETSSISSEGKKEEVKLQEKASEKPGKKEPEVSEASDKSGKKEPEAEKPKLKSEDKKPEFKDTKEEKISEKSPKKEPEIKPKEISPPHAKSSDLKGSKEESKEVEITPSATRRKSSIILRSESMVDSEEKRPQIKRATKSTECEPGEAAEFTCEVTTDAPTSIIWLKENRPLDDKLADRVKITSKGGLHSLKIVNCRDEDSGLYTAKITSEFGTASCSAHLIVHECIISNSKGDVEVTPEERKKKAEANTPCFIVKFKDTELLEETTVSFFLNVKGQPNPKLKILFNDKPLVPSDRIKLNSEHSDKGSYELTIEHITPDDAGVYKAIATNSYGSAECEATVTVTNEKVLFAGLNKTLLAPGEEPTFTWFRDGAEFDPEDRFKVMFKDDEDSLALVFQHVKPDDAGLYTCVGSTSSGRMSCSAELTVQGAVSFLLREPEPPEILLELTDTEVSVGGSAMLELRVKGYPKPNAIMYKDGEEVMAGGKYRFLYEDDESIALIIKGVSTDDAGTYKLVATNELGTAETTGKLYVKAPPKFKTKMKDMACQVDQPIKMQIEVEGTPTPDVKFYKNGQLIIESERIKIVQESNEKFSIYIERVTMEDSGAYSVVASNAIGQMSEFWNLIAQMPAKIVEKLSERFEKEEKESVTFTVKTQGIPEPQVKWIKNGEEITIDGKKYVTKQDGASYSLTVKEITRSDTAHFTCEVSNQFGKDSSSSDLVVKRAPKITEGLKNFAAKQGECAEYSVKCDAYPKPGVKWFIDGIEIDGKAYEKIEDESSGTFKLKIPKVEASGEVKVKLENQYGYDESSASLTVKSKPVIKEGLKDVHVLENEQLDLKVIIGGTEPNVKWFHNGNEVSADARIKITRESTETYHLSFNVVLPADRGNWEVKASNDLGECSSKCVITVEVCVVRELSQDESVSQTPRDVLSPKVSEPPDTPTSINGVSHISLAAHDLNICEIASKQRSIIEEEEEEDEDPALQDLLKRVQKQRSVLGEILDQEESRGQTSPGSQDQKGFADLSSNEEFREIPEKAMAGEGAFDADAKHAKIQESECTQDQRRPSFVTSKPIFEKKISESIEVTESDEMLIEVIVGAEPKPTIRWMLGSKEITKSERVTIITNEMESTVRTKSVLKIHKVMMEDAGELTCVAENKHGSSESKGQVKVTSSAELKKPKITAGLGDASCKAGHGVTLEAGIGGQAPEIKWFKDGNEIVDSPKAKKGTSGDGKFTLQLKDAASSDAGTYTVRAKNEWGDAESSGRLDVLFKPEIIGLKDIYCGPGEVAKFEATVKANPSAKVSWTKGKETIKESPKVKVETAEGEDGAVTYRLTIKVEDKSDSDSYSLKASNEIGETTSTAKIHMQIEPPEFIKGLSNVQLKDGESLELKVRVTGVPTPKVEFTRDGKVCQNVASDIEKGIYTINVDKVTPADFGKYEAKAKNAAGETETSCSVKMLQTPPTFGKMLDKRKSFDEGEPLELKAKVDGSPFPKVQWLKDGVPVVESDRIKMAVLPDGTCTLVINKCTPADGGNYTISATNPNGENLSNCIAEVNSVPKKPTFEENLSGPDKVKAGEPFKLQAKVTGWPKPILKFLKDGKPLKHGAFVTEKPDGTIMLEVTSATPADAGKYSLIASSDKGDVSQDLQVQVLAPPSKPKISEGLQDVKVVEGFPVQLQTAFTGNPNPEIKWMKDGQPIALDTKIIEKPDGSKVAQVCFTAGPADAGTYTMVVSNPEGSTETKAQVAVISKSGDGEPLAPSFISGLLDQDVDEGGDLNLNAKVVGNPLPDISWFRDEVAIPADRGLPTFDGSRVGLSLKGVRPTDAGNYECRLKNPHGEASSKSNVGVRKIYQAPSFTNRFGNAQQMPTYDYKFVGRIGGIPSPEVSWNKNGLPISESDKYRIKRDGDSVSLMVRNCVRDDAGKYSCHLKNIEGQDKCEAMLEIVDKIEKRERLESPYFLKKIGDCDVYEGMTGKFTACVGGAPEPDFEWFKDGVRLFPSDRIRFEREGAGLLRLVIGNVVSSDVGRYRLHIKNSQGEDWCDGLLNYDTLDSRPKRPVGDQYMGFDKFRQSGLPLPLADRPIISRMTDRYLTLSWKPSIPHASRFPVTYQVEMCECPEGEWFCVRKGIRSCACDIRNLEPNRDYKFRIRVENQYGVSDPSPYAQTLRSKFDLTPPQWRPPLHPSIPRDYDLDRPPHDGYTHAPRFLNQEHDTQYAVLGRNATIYWWVYGYPKPQIDFEFNNVRTQFDHQYERNGQISLFLSRMTREHVGMYEAIATNIHGEARQRIKLAIAEHPRFLTRPEETYIMARKSGRITAVVTGIPEPQFKFYKDWLPLGPSNRIKIQTAMTDEDIYTVTLTINDTILKDEGLYSLVCTNVAGSIQTSVMIHIEESEDDYHWYSYGKERDIKRKNKNLNDFYDTGDELGRGTQGITYHVVERSTGKSWANKCMRGTVGQRRTWMENEYSIQNGLNHRNITRIVDAFDHPDGWDLVTELSSGGELIDSLTRHEYLTESDIAHYIRQILWGLEYLHNKNIAHLGLTPGDLLISRPDGDELRISDFGLARRITSKLTSLDYGMPEFVAPEIVNGRDVSYPADLWSVGIITYLLLGGTTPFRGENDRETLTNIKNGNWGFSEHFERISSEGRDFISKLIVSESECRMNISAALRHPWLRMADRVVKDAYQIRIDRLKKYYSGFREWYSNASCRDTYRRRPLSGAFTHPSKMVYPPNYVDTPERGRTPQREPREFPETDAHYPRPDLDYEIGMIKSESHYQSGPDTYLLQLRDADFPARLRQYMKVAAYRSPALALQLKGTAYDRNRTVIRERRRFTDVMDEEIDDERKNRIAKYGEGPWNSEPRRLRHEIGPRMDAQVEADAIMSMRRDGSSPLFREKPPMTIEVDLETPLEISVIVAGDPKPDVQWFKNDLVVAENNRIHVTENGAISTLRFDHLVAYDQGPYKVTARNKNGQITTKFRVIWGEGPSKFEGPVNLDISCESTPIEVPSGRFTDYGFGREIVTGKHSLLTQGHQGDRDLLLSITSNGEEAQKELEHLRSLRHIRLANIVGYFVQDDFHFLVKEGTGADILRVLANTHQFSEQSVCVIFSQILDALAYLHWRGLALLNLEPGNVVLDNPKNPHVRIVDLSSAQSVTKIGSRVENRTSIEFTAPEVINEEPALPQTDLWSVGVLLYVILSGISPFKGANPDETRQNVLYVRFRFEHLFKEITQEATRFIMLIFKRNPMKRPTVDEAFEHRWLLPSEFMVKKRERAQFLGHRLKEICETYHNGKAKTNERKSTILRRFGIQEVSIGPNEAQLLEMIDADTKPKMSSQRVTNGSTAKTPVNGDC